jgi:hypothetical protein
MTVCKIEEQAEGSHEDRYYKNGSRGCQLDLTHSERSEPSPAAVFGIKDVETSRSILCELK